MMIKKGAKRLVALCTVILSIVSIQGCAVVAVGAAGVAAKVATDRRTVGTQLDDQTSEGKVAFNWSQNDALKELTNLQVNVYNGVALLTGQAPSASLIEDALRAAKKVDSISKIHNQIRVGEPIAATTQANDIWLASKVRAQLLADERIPALQVKVVVEDSEVFLLGRVNNQEATSAVDIARNITGVTRVVRAFQILQ
ncbi:division/outer membrane stress-associated lipid-binding lipoprotein [Alteromonas sp. ASW11-130]|uniref:division/outer membrane stress-associated lipid-binding lipoprotein n=1 Tax=Alteromonas sp. ASW11-130 TaxID=3015775 RepID=UPI002242082D|nr:division/outer membrane stress-associated lipid-binding lipoprotein [Alteromonas sp. ASW11-130]MCW8091796.1 division/outer membrane stress-associated lipid-binding lipoprotein [Alteromonas sp. ASW11-130]